MDIVDERKNRVIIEFPDSRARDSFISWLSCQGEQGFLNWEEIAVTDDRKGSAAAKDFGMSPVTRIEYNKFFDGLNMTIEAQFEKKG